MLIFSYMQIKRYKYCIRVKQSIKVVFRYRQKGEKEWFFNEKFNKNLTIDLDFYGSSPVCKFEAKCTKNLSRNCLLCLKISEIYVLRANTGTNELQNRPFHNISAPFMPFTK